MHTRKLETILALIFGSAIALTVHGYQFGKSNHTVYLLDAMRHASPELLKNDWFTTQTLQYHAVFGLMTRGLMKIHALPIGFAMGYAALLVLMQLAWLRLTKLLGGSVVSYMLSVVFFYASAGGTGLGAYQFLQDGAFLPSNIASIAMLWGLVFWIAGKPRAAGVCVGVAGMFHLNYAVVGVLVWMALLAWGYLRPFASYDRAAIRDGTIAVLGLCLFNIALAMRALHSLGTGLPLAEFVDLYVRLRHPHHYDPASWPAALWIAFLWPIPLALRALTPSPWYSGERAGERGMVLEKSDERSTPDVARPSPQPSPRSTREREKIRALRITIILFVLISLALIGAGVFWFSETLIQLSLYRFSIFIKLFTCIAAAIWIKCKLARPRAIGFASASIGIAMIIIGILRGPYFGFYRVPEDDAKYLAACDWIRANTPADAVFLVPPNEQSFRLRAQRAIVVNFKGVPQLSSELPQWRDRMSDVLNLRDLRTLPRGFNLALEAIRSRYEALPPETLFTAARKYGARYVLTAHPLDSAQAFQVSMTGNAYFLYDLQTK